MKITLEQIKTDIFSNPYYYINMYSVEDINYIKKVKYKKTYRDLEYSKKRNKKC